MGDLLSTATSPWAQPELWDSITIGGLVWRGKIEITGASRKYTWSINDGNGYAGAYEVFVSQPPARFSIKFYVWADQQYSTYLALLDVLSYSPTHLAQSPPSSKSSAGQINALRVVHPQLQNNHITAVIVAGIGDLVKESDDLLYAFTVEFIEFTPQKEFPPQVPDTAADKNDPLISPQVKDAIAQALESQRQTAQAAANAGLIDGLP